MNKISESVVGIPNTTKEISTAISEQVGGGSEINRAVSQIDQNTQKQVRFFAVVVAAGSVLSTEAEALKRSATRFKTSGDIVDFKSEKPTPIVPKSQKRIAPDRSGNLAKNLNGWGELKKGLTIDQMPRRKTFVACSTGGESIAVPTQSRDEHFSPQLTRSIYRLSRQTVV